MFLEGIFNGSVQTYLNEAQTLINDTKASVLICNVLTDYFDIEPKKSALNDFLDAVRDMGVTTAVVFNSQFQTQDLSGVHTDTLEFINFHLWRAYNEIIVKKTSTANAKWNHSANQFLFLTGKPENPHRLRLLWKLQQAQLLDRCCWSFFYNADQVDQLHGLIPEVTRADLPALLDSLRRNPDNIDMLNQGTSFHYCGLPYNVQLFSSSRFRLISESIFGRHAPLDIGRNYWLGEKTYITLFNRVPWIIAGEPGSLSWLKSQGYETFDDHLIESYDWILNPEQRLDAIVKNTDAWIQHGLDTARVDQQVEHNFAWALEQARLNETRLYKLAHTLNVAATPEQLVPTVDK